jgi:hypothetical protein
VLRRINRLMVSHAFAEAANPRLAARPAGAHRSGAQYRRCYREGPTVQVRREAAHQPLSVQGQQPPESSATPPGSYQQLCRPSQDHRPCRTMRQERR